MNRKSYPSDLTDEQWDVLFPALPPARPGGRPRTVDLQEVINGILYVLRAGCSWQMVPHDLPPWQTLYKYFRQWTSTVSRWSCRYWKVTSNSGFPRKRE